MKKQFHRIAAFLLVLMLSFQIILPSVAGDDVVEIKTVQDLVQFAKNCSLDTWSQGKTVILQSDLSLKNVEFASIATFGGTFDGNGHTISDVTITQGTAPTGFFRILQKDAVIKDLNIIGTVDPFGDGQNVGGIVGENNGTITNCSFTGEITGKQNTGAIAGINAVTGKIENCRTAGVVEGNQRTGGIAGYNLGIISNCNNNALVNTSGADQALNVADLSFDFSLDLANLESQEIIGVSMDTGGIAGYSSGAIQNCKNEGTIGYQHVGYNVGGIAGRNCGYIQNCTNSAEIFGRKDIGGIIGQAEPYIAISISEDSLSKLKNQLDALEDQIDHTLDNSESGVSTITNRLNQIADYIDSVSDVVSEIESQASLEGNITGNAGASGNGSITFVPPGIDIEDGELTITPPGIEGEGETEAGGTIDTSAQINLSTSLGQLSAAVSGMSGQMKLLNNEIAGTAGSLTSDLRSIGDQIDTISSTIFELGNTSTGDVVTDASEKNIDSVIEGKMFQCTNLGNVQGDLNVGGIVGAMAIEYELDPEDDVTADISGANRKAYELKAIIQNCENTGKIVSKKNYAGNICGRMDLGLITSCNGFGKAQSETGDYVGGIAGLAGGTIQNSFAKCTIQGSQYIGGIIGSGVTEDLSGSGSTVSGCYALVSIEEGEQYVGAISGADAGKFLENYFVSEELAGINQISYAGRAMPITYEKLEKVQNLPEEMKTFTLSFAIEDQVVKSVPFEYGATFEESVYPEIPEKEGYYAKWEKSVLENLQCDTIVNAVYSKNKTALASEEVRKDGRNIFLIEGAFEDTDSVTIESQEQLYKKDRTWLDRLKGRQVVEEWSIDIPEDGEETRQIRYLPLEGKMRSYYLYMKDGENWEKVEGEMVGSYFVFSATGNHLELAAISTYTAWWVWLLVLVSLILLGGVLFLIIKKKRLPILSKKCMIFIGIFAAIVLIALLLFVSYFKKGVDVYHLIQDYANQSEISMELKVQTDLDTKHLETEVHVNATEIDEKKVVCIEQMGIPLYFCDDVIFLENGKAYSVSELTPEYTKLLSQLVTLYQAVEIKTSSEGSQKVHQISIKQEDAKEILEILVPSLALELSETQTLNVELMEENEGLKEIRFNSTGALNDSAKTTITVSAELVVKEIEESYDIPQLVQDAIKADSYEVVGELNQDMFRLLFAWMNLEKEEQTEMKWSFSADCGPISINESGNSEISTQEAATIPERLLEIVYQVCLNGTFNCSESGENYIYTLILDEEGMKNLVTAIAPEAAEMELILDSGSIQLVVEKEEFCEMKIGCEGSTEILGKAIDVSFSAELELN